ncbi:MAG: protein kinase domain-containing protein [Vibrio gallaecicus]
MIQKEDTTDTIEARFHSQHYTLLEQIGEGGFGKVYKALQLSTEKVVAIKFLTLTGTECPQKRQKKIARFKRECDLVRRLNHPNIVSLLDKGQQGECLLYAVYEFVDGTTLKEYIDSQGQIAPAEAAEIMACVLDALAHAHELGIIHRDIKPANIMLFNVGAKQHVKILDFGISTLKNDGKHSDFQTLTLNDETLGTPQYSAPEQLRGEPSLPQTDVYAWGLVFLECLTGTPTIKGNSAASIFYHQLSAANIPLGTLAGHHSAQFFRRVLHKKALERPGNTIDLYREFRRFNFSDLVPTASRAPSTQALSLQQESITQTGFLSSTRSQFTERKEITALCIILSEDRTNSNESAHDKQDIAEMLLSDHHHQCVDIALRYGATQVGTVGDTTLFYFGYPVVSDNDSRLSARAALDIWNNLHSKQTSLSELHDIKFELRIGLSKGMMRSIDGAIPEGRVSTEAMALARNAQPEEIACSPLFKDMLSHQLLFEPIRNDSTPAAPYGYRLKGERLSEAFSFLRKSQSNNAIFGRQEILEKLLLLNRPYGQYQLFHIYGEAGIGKSRLLLELKECLSHTNVFPLQCLPEFQTNALYPLLNFFSVHFDLNGEHAEYNYKHAIDSLSLSPLEKERGSAILWAWLQPYSKLSRHSEKEFQQSISNLSLSQQKSYLFLTLSHLLQLACSEGQEANGKGSCLFVCEDLHWSDATTLEFIRYLVESSNYMSQPFRWLSTSRTQHPDEFKQAKILEIELSSISPIECHHLIEHLFDNMPISDRVKQLLTTRSDGNPLFLEELVLYAQKNGLVKKVNGHIDFVVSEPESHVPENLRSSLQQKLNDLTFAKDTAQLAAAIGRTFSNKLIQQASDKNTGQIQADLDELQRTNIIFIQRSVEGSQYQFKHALIRDAIYESSTTQHKSHQQLANAMEANIAETAYPSALIGDHWAKTLSPSRATPYYLKAGEQAAQASMVDDAIQYFEKSLKISLHENEEDRFNSDKLSALVGLGDNLIRLAKHDEARAYYLDALQENKLGDALVSASLHVKYGKSLETHHLHAQALKSYEQAETLLNTNTVKNTRWYNTWLTIQLCQLYIYYWRNKLPEMQNVLHVIEAHLDHFNDPLSQAQFYDAKLQFELRNNRYDLSQEQIDLAQQAYDASLKTDDHPLQTHCLFSLGFTCLFSQQYSTAKQHLLAALEHANEKADTTLKTRCLAYLVVLFRLQGDIDNTRIYLKQALFYARESGMDDYVAIASANEAWLTYKQDDFSGSQTFIEESNQIWKALSNEFPFPLQWLALLIELELLAHAQPDKKRDSAQERIIAVVTTLLDSSQHALPHSVVNPLKEIINDRSNHEYHQQLVENALTNAKALGYL